MQIRKELLVRWQDVDLRIQSAGGHWTLEVRDAAKGEVLYTARRMNAWAAQVAATEFALFHAGSLTLDPPETLAGKLAWRERY